MSLHITLINGSCSSATWHDMRISSDEVPKFFDDFSARSEEYVSLAQDRVNHYAMMAWILQVVLHSNSLPNYFGCTCPFCMEEEYVFRNDDDDGEEGQRDLLFEMEAA